MSLSPERNEGRTLYESARVIIFFVLLFCFVFGTSCLMRVFDGLRAFICFQSISPMNLKSPRHLFSVHTSGAEIGDVTKQITNNLIFHIIKAYAQEISSCRKF